MSDLSQDKRFEIQPNTTFQDFMSVMDTDRRTAQIDGEALQLIFERVRDQLDFSWFISRCVS